MNTSTTYPDGRVTPYGFGCGYVESTEGPRQGVRLWQEGCYHVRRHWNADGPDGLAGYSRQSWRSFDTLTEARRYYRREVTRITRGDLAHADGQAAPNGGDVNE